MFYKELYEKTDGYGSNVYNKIMNIYFCKKNQSQPNIFSVLEPLTIFFLLNAVVILFLRLYLINTEKNIYHYRQKNKVNSDEDTLK